MKVDDSWVIGGKKFQSRLLLGTARYPSLEAMRSSIVRAKSEIITVSLRRESSSQNKTNRFWNFVRDLPVNFLPNTAGCFGVSEAVETAEMARDLFETNWIKLEVIGNYDTLCPDPFGLVEAAQILVRRGFEVFPYTTDDLIVCEKLVDSGCRVLMPWASPIGTGRGLSNPSAISILRKKFPQVTLIIDAGLGRPSHAAAAMELGCDGILLNTAVATAIDPGLMSQAFSLAVEAGRWGYLAGLMEERKDAVSSTPLKDRAFQEIMLGSGEASS